MGRLFTVVGLPYYDYNDNKDHIKKGDYITLKKDPENKFDKNAVMAYYKNLPIKIGYISQQENEYLFDNFDDLNHITYTIYSFYKNVILIEEHIRTKELIDFPEYKFFSYVKSLLFKLIRK
ncbi:MAG: hypothetical protein EHM20_00150 [Alphaproteobacteria bacterium]|nr:MAG: hypothetical protein EHM20_00150 [Alphaproteobacteria bacterium]